MPQAEAARTFGIGISTVKRYVDKAQKGEDLAPKKPPGQKRKLDEVMTRLLAKDLKERATATLSQRREYLERVAGVQVSPATISRAIKRLGWSRKKDCEYCDHGCRDVSLGQSDPKKRGLSAFPPIRRPAQRTSRRHRLEPFVTS